ncbi:hypothetical protein INT45_002551 [Circinella minor]|uniref:Reverse transcriptase domain-containing protein n=1 Tax=Circinella minor TaxID=1195481 RepID=A0A8H7VCF9_9FUNG|nr:hypothetical protein INT45_002551 [Circinella minor]
MAGIPTQVSPGLNVQTILSDYTNPTTAPMSAETAQTNSSTTTTTPTASRRSPPTPLESLGEIHQQPLGSLYNQRRFSTPVPLTTSDHLSPSTNASSYQGTTISSTPGNNRIIAIEPVTIGSGFSSTMFIIPKRNGGFRPVFNLKTLNQYLHAPKFKMETLQQVIKMLQPNDFLTSIDLADAFLHIAVHHQLRRYLRFNWEGQTFQFRTTPFSLSQVPWLFTKLCQPILKWARNQDIWVMAYLDDWLIIGKSPHQTASNTTQIINKLQELGWLVNIKKSNLQPQQQINHLGYQLNTKLPGSKLRDLRRSIHSLLHCPLQTPRRVHNLTICIKAATIALFPA